MPRQSAGLLLFRRTNGFPEIFLVHPGGPFWAGKDEGAWSIPKGEFGDDEAPLAAAKREFEEETGFAAGGDFIPLQPLKQPSGKIVYAWAVEMDVDASLVKSNEFTMQWPPNSGKMRSFPEVDRAEWLSVPAARKRILKGQADFISQLERKLGISPSG